MWEDEAEEERLRCASQEQEAGQVITRSLSPSSTTSSTAASNSRAHEPRSKEYYWLGSLEQHHHCLGSLEQHHDIMILSILLIDLKVYAHPARELVVITQDSNTGTLL